MAKHSLSCWVQKYSRDIDEFVLADLDGDAVPQSPSYLSRCEITHTLAAYHLSATLLLITTRNSTATFNLQRYEYDHCRWTLVESLRRRYRVKDRNGGDGGDGGDTVEVRLYNLHQRRRQLSSPSSCESLLPIPYNLPLSLHTVLYRASNSRCSIFTFTPRLERRLHLPSCS